MKYNWYSDDKTLILAICLIVSMVYSYNAYEELSQIKEERMVKVENDIAEIIKGVKKYNKTQAEPQIGLGNPIRYTAPSK